MNQRFVRLAAAPILLLGAAVAATSSTPRFWQVATQADFLKGDLENVSLDDLGRLTLGPGTDLLYDANAPFVWAMALAPDGTLYAGTGNDGKVLRIDPQGRTSLAFDALEIEVHALAIGPDGALYVGTSPGGKVYKVDRAGGATVVLDPGDRYVWALTFDAKGNLFAATGEKGVIYRVTPDGKGAPFYRTTASHATALAVDQAGNLLVGTAAPGRVIRVGPDARGFVLLDTPYQEVKSLWFDGRGALYVAALNGRPTPAPAPAPADERTPPPALTDPARPPPVPSVTTEITSITVADSGLLASTPPAIRDDRLPSKGGVYRVLPDGVWDRIWESREDSPYALASDATGSLLVGTGNKGKIFRLSGDPSRPTLLARGAGQQVTSFLRDSQGRLHYSTSNPGKLFRMASDASTRGAYESDVRDARGVASWGSLSWQASVPSGAAVELFTRSGNVETPDDTWSAWSPAYTNSSGSPIASPKARFLQWRAVLTGKQQGPVLTSVAVAYLPRNVRPQVRSLTVHPPGVVFQKPFSTGDPDLAGFDDQTTPERKLASQVAVPQSASAAPNLGRRTFHKHLQTFVWRAEDEDEDDLSFDVQYRREGETAWKTLRSGLTEPILVWDTTTVPNGTYFIKVIASDLPSNAASAALIGEMEGSAFDIDNTPPAIGLVSARTESGRTSIVVDVRDDQTAIQRVEYSLDGRQWRSVFPIDGLADTKTERYQIVVEEPVAHDVVLRALDRLNNVATLHVVPRR